MDIINTSEQIINVNVVEEVIEVNIVEEVITIQAPTGGYPTPSTVYSVFGRTGAVVGQVGDYNTSQVTESGNLYFTNARARASISLYTVGTSGAATYDPITGILNIPNYQSGVTSFNGRTGAIMPSAGDYSTSIVAEGTNLYFTNSRARAALSAGTGITYNSTTGTINSSITQYTDALARASISAGTGISYNSGTGVITNSSPDQTVTMTAGTGISVTGTYPNFTITSTITAYNDSNARNAISVTTIGTSGLASYTSSTGVINIPGYTLAGLGGQPLLSGTGFVKSTAGVISYDTNTYYLASNPNGYTSNLGTVTSVSGTGSVSGLTLTGSVVGIGSLTLGGTLTLTSGQITTGLGYTPVPNTRTLTINGTTYDLSADRSWTISTYAGYTSQVQHAVKAAVAINKGQAVYVSGGDGTNMIVSLATNDSESGSSKVMGLLDATVNANGFANVITEGLLAGLNTSTASIGDAVWLGTGGNLLFGLASKPYAPANLVFIGVVTRVNASNGEIFINTQNGFEMEELHNVSALGPNNGDILKYVAATGLWTKTAGTTTNIPEGTNLYYTDGRSRGAISLTTTGSSGSATYSNSTGVFNIPTYTLAGLGGQASSTNLTSLSGLTYASASFVKMTAAGTFALDTNTYLTANQSITLSGDISGTGTTAITTAIGANKVTNAMLAQISTASFLGRVTAGTGNVETLNGTQATSLLDVFSSTLKGLVPASGGGTTTFLRADGTWATIAAGGGTVTTVSVVSANGFAATIANASTTPAITLSTTITGLLKGNGTAISAASAGTDYQAPISLTTTGSSGAATFITNTLNIPTYTLSGLGGQPALNGTGFVKISGTTISYDNSTYLTANQSITLSGAVTGSGTTAITTTLANSVVGIANLSATGTPSATTYLRGDNTWATVTGGVSSVFTRTGAVVAQSGDYNTSQVTESGNLYYTDTRARNAITLTTSGSTGAATYNPTTGVLNIPQYTGGSGGVAGYVARTITTFTATAAQTTFTVTYEVNNIDVFMNGAKLNSSEYTATNGTSVVLNAAALAGDILEVYAYTAVSLLTSLSASAPLSYNNTTGAFSISQATTSTNGYLSSTDWNTFNGKQDALGYTPYNSTNPSNYIALTALSSTATGLTYTNTTGVFSLTSGYVIPTTTSATNWDTAYTNRITSLTTTGSSGAATLIGGVLNIPQYGGGGISLTSLSATTPLSYNNTTGEFSIQVANTSQSGYLTSTDWNTFNGKLNTNNPAFTGVLTTGTMTYTPVNHLMSLQSSVNSYNQIVFQNSNSGVSASADIVVNNNLSTETTYYGDFGINGSNFSGTGSLGTPNAVYLTATTGKLALGTTTSHAVSIVTNGSATDNATFLTTGQLVLPSYTSTTSFTGTAAGYLAFDASGNIITVATPSTSYSVTTQTTTYSVTATTGTVIVKGDTTSAGFTITLPTAVGNTSMIVIKKVVSANTLTINTTSSQTIDGGLTAQLKLKDASITLISDNANWQII